MKNRRFEIVKRKFLSDKGMWLAAAFLLLVIIASIAVDYTGLDPEAIDVSNMLGKPSSVHWFGTDELGRDYFTRVLYGARVSLIVGVLAMVTSVFIGVTVGMISGYFGV